MIPTLQTCNTLIVVPCYNEEARLPLTTFRDFAQLHPEIGFLFVNDGSTDRTIDVLTEFCRDQERCEVLDLPKNHGKGGAVRAGMMHCLNQGRAKYVGYWDADLATPLSAIPDFVRTAEERPRVVMVTGSRVMLLGRNIVRRRVRHYIGRVFATLASVMLNLAIYDTQCGAKLFRASESLKGLFEDMFVSRWIFDVEIIARLKQSFKEPAERLIFEYPLWQWEDVAGSKLRGKDFFAAAKDLVVIWRKYRQ